MAREGSAAPPGTIANQALIDQATGVTPIVATTAYWRDYDRRNPFVASGNSTRDIGRRQTRLSLERRYPNGPPSGYDFGANGTLEQTTGSKWKQGLKTAIVPAAFLAGGYGLGALLAGGGAAAAGGGGYAAAGGGGYGAGGAALGGTGLTAGGGAAATASGLFKSFLPYGLQAATNIYGLITQRNANNQAADAELTASREQLDYLKAKDAEDRAQFERTEKQRLAEYMAREGRMTPYRNIGEMATRTLTPLLRTPKPYGTLSTLVR